jgi:tetratricopeptide (TPR) repeat protein
VVIPMLAGGRARALHRLGRHREELEFARQWLERFPDVAQVQEAEVRALAALGDLTAVDKALERASLTTFRRGRKEDVAYTAVQELRAHGHHDASVATAERALGWLRDSGRSDQPQDLYMRCDLLMYAGRDAEALEVSQDAIEATDSPDLLVPIGVLKARLGDRQGALAADRRLAALDLPMQGGVTTYLRAAIAANLDDLDGAMSLLRRAISEGAAHYDDLHTSILFDPLRGRDDFQELLEPKG